MPLTYLGQLGPTMEQQIALQRSLLELIREDEEMRKKAAKKPVGEPTKEPAERPALARRMVTDSAKPGGYGTPGGEPAFKGGMQYAPLTDWAKVREEALARQLRGAEPTPGYISGEERMRTAREKIAGEKEELAGKAGEFWERITPLDDAGRKVALDAARELQPQLYDALIEQGFVDPATGEAVRPEVEKKVKFRKTRITEGWEYEDITYEDGTTESRILGVAPKAEVTGPTISEQISLARLRFDIDKYERSDVETILKEIGPAPIVGTSMRRPGTNVYREVEQEDVEEYYKTFNESLRHYRASRGDVRGMDDIKILYENDPESIKTIQPLVGMEPDGVWSDELEQKLFNLFSGEE